MSNELESALLIRLNPVVEWGSALEPGLRLRTVDAEAPFDALAFQQRDRELAFRDLVNAAAIVDASIEVSSVWNAPAIRPVLQGMVPSSLRTNGGDYDVNGWNAGQVVHVTSMSVPAEALETDRSLATRDVLIYEALVRACQVFADPPVVSTHGSPATTSNWSLGEGAPLAVDINMALPLEKRLFKRPDQNLAERDNQLAGYVAKLAEVLRNPFEFANRLYVKVTNVSGATESTGLDLRELEVYTLAEPVFKPGAAYAKDAEIQYLGQYGKALRSTSVLPTLEGGRIKATDDWQPIDALTKRTWVAEPLLSDRNRIIYDYTLKTLQWMRESTMQIHIPQIYGLSIPGVLDYQRLVTAAEIPKVKDALFWRRKAARIVHGTQAWQSVAHQTQTASEASMGTAQLDCASLLSGAATERERPLRLRLGAPVTAGDRYRVSLLVRPSSTVQVAGNATISVHAYTGPVVVAGGVGTLTLSQGHSISAGQRLNLGTEVDYRIRGSYTVLPLNPAVPTQLTFATGAPSGTYANVRVTVQVPPLLGGAVGFTREFSQGQSPMEWRVPLPPGTWLVRVQYTNALESTEGFGIRTTVVSGGNAEPTPLADETVPWTFFDADGNPLTNGTVVSSPEMQLRSDGTDQVIQLRWVYGSGALDRKSTRLNSSHVSESRMPSSA